MKLILKRTYFEHGTNGELYHAGELVCYMIELPWLMNQQNVSCIPEGMYELNKRYTKERGWHIHLPKVEGRNGILIHAANDAMHELEGCLAPVTSHTGPGMGINSRAALKRLEALVFAAMEKGEKVELKIKEMKKLNIVDRAKAPTPRFFKVLQIVGLSLAAAGGAIMAAPVALPAGIAALGGYLTVGGSVLTAVGQVTVDEDRLECKNDGH